ncbi:MULTISPECIES: hypothetical protein [Paenibacillus]|uniref:hypothetical protein n=1 Tax=Paenibacillus TaxID=44249 RepID=UPI0011438D83|nr:MULTISPECIES: hypothetical protein [unclassified Paenibacillus]
MDIKSLAVCLYLLLVYWLSLHFPSLKSLFYPTLGAFSYLFASRSFAIKDLVRMTVGAGAASMIGTGLYIAQIGLMGFMLTVLTTFFLIKRFHLNAPPILAVSLVPYFAQPQHFWTTPIAVLATLAGLVVTLLAVQMFCALYVRLRSNAADAAAKEGARTPAP